MECSICLFDELATITAVTAGTADGRRNHTDGMQHLPNSCNSCGDEMQHLPAVAVSVFISLHNALYVHQCEPLDLNTKNVTAL